MKTMSPAKQLLANFLVLAERHNYGIAPSKIAITNTFRIGPANVLVRVASTSDGRFLFGLNYLNAEEILNMDNAFIAFICGNENDVILLPSSKLAEMLPFTSHDRNGEYKIVITHDFKFALAGKGHRFDGIPFFNNWSLLSDPKLLSVATMNPLDNIHSLIQGRLISMGKLRSLETFCPNKVWTFNGQQLGEISTLKECPKLQFTDHDLLRQIDVIWFRRSNNDLYPVCAFEVEITTGVWSGFGRLATLRELRTKLFIVTDDKKKFTQVSGSFPDMRKRCINVSTSDIGFLYHAEVNVIRLRKDYFE